MRHGAGRWCVVAVLLLALVDRGHALADGGGGGDAGGGDTGGGPAARALVCGAIDFEGCCELDTAHYCDETGKLRRIWCADNQTNTACGLEGPFVNCMPAGADPAPRCSDVPQPVIGDYAIEDPGELAGTCPTLPSRLAMDPTAPSTCPGAPAVIDLYQKGCSFVLTPLSDEAEGAAIGQIEGRAAQISFQRGDKIVTCLARLADDDTAISGACDGPWGFDDTACTWSYTGAFGWPGPQPRTHEPAAPTTDGAGGGGTDTVRDTSGGGSGCHAGGHGSPTAAFPHLSLLLGLAVARVLRRRGRAWSTTRPPA